MENLVTVEISYSGRNFGAYVPILPGCVATGANLVEVKQNIIDAIAFHVKGSLQDGDAIPGIFKKEYHFIFKFDTQSL